MAGAPFHVLIIGGGIGGLCLAQGLQRAGVSAAVYERDRTRADRLQGYRIHINPAGSRALHACLPPDLYETFVATCGKSGDGFTFLTEQLEELLFIGADGAGAAPDPVESHKSVSRITLRQVLLAGLGDMVRFDKTFTRYEEAPDGRITARFADGTAANGDVLVAADGANSRVRRQFLPHAERVDTGVLAIAGKVALTDETRALLPPKLFVGPASVVAPRGYSMFIAVQEFRREAGVAVGAIGGDDDSAALHPGLLFDNTADYVMWSLAARREKFGVAGDPEALDGCALRDVTLGIIEGWHPRLRRLVRATDPTTIAPIPIRTSVPIAPWVTRRVTLLGDAIHSMTPFRGIGANTALRDAALLCRNLVAAHRSERPLLEAIHDYEAEMIEYGFDAVRGSKRACEQAVSDSGVALVMMKAAFRALNAAPRLKRWVFRGFGE
ncbi:MAG: FAD-dependent monooxygenase [Chloroflexota bacterium]|nr:FAD-dependent monooxygenase [Chloroflexota bacterium]